ncbi:MAG TPA: sodium-dependent transporter [Gemmatimonadales bacterium]|nr:sodium-dependent transporter [Gemmatimonadales bacterium]
MSSSNESFSSRWLMMLAMLGMAVGTGNIWRFPRIAAQNGGGSFLVTWVVFLLLWSIPLILVEFGAGRMTRTGPVGAFIRMMGPRWAWMGAWVAFCAVAIMFYYSVVTGWTLRYVAAAALGEIPRAEPGGFWNGYTGSWTPVLTHAIAIGAGTVVVARGVRAIERVAQVLMPVLLVLVVALTVRAVTLPGASGGLAYLYTVHWHELSRADIWLQALTQNAWDTGAGWGLVLVYAAYMRQNEDTALNAFILPTANNVVSLMAGTMVLCTVFSVVPQLVASLATHPEALSAYPGLVQAVQQGQAITPELIRSTIFGAGNEGLTFIWMPQLFARLPFGQLFMVLFFVALAFAAFTSLLAMIELGSRVLRDMGMERGRAVRLVGAVGFLAGLPSAISLQVLHNQDWVWGVALMVSGLFFAIAVITSGVRRFREEQLNHAGSDIRIGRWWEIVIGVVVPLEAVVLLVWWLYQARGWDPTGWLDPFGTENVGTILLQWGVVFAALLLGSRWLARRTHPVPPTAEDTMPASVP